MYGLSPDFSQSEFVQTQGFILTKVTEIICVRYTGT